MADDLTSRVADLAQFLSALTRAAVEADSMAAETLRRFIETVGFEPHDAGDAGLSDSEMSEEMRAALGPVSQRLGRLRYVTFSYDAVVSGQKTTQVVRVPLLSLLPLPALAVKEAEFEMSLDLITTSRPAPRVRGTSGRTVALSESEAGENDRGVPKLLAAVAPQGPRRTEQSESAHLHVLVRMEQADMPAGLSAMLNLLNAGTSSTSVENPHNAVQGDQK